MVTSSFFPLHGELCEGDRKALGAHSYAASNLSVCSSFLIVFAVVLLSFHRSSIFSIQKVMHYSTCH